MLLAAVAIPMPASAAVSFEPSVESRLVGSYSSDQSPTKRSWNEIAAGLQSSVDTDRLDFDLLYRYGQRIPISGETIDDSRHSGSGLLRSELVRDLLYLDAQGAATMLNTSVAGQIDPDGDDPREQQTFSASLQPALRRQFGQLLLNLRYSYGIFEVDGRSAPLRAGRPYDPNQSFTAGASDTRNQSASLSLGNVGRSDRLRWRLVGEYQRDAIEQLDQRYTSKRVTADGEYALTRTVALIGNVGYEDILDRQDGVLLDATGLPILDATGLVQIDPVQPVITTFDTNGLTYEAGFRLSPSRRTNFIARAGKRFGDFTAAGSFELRLTRGIRMFATYTESINNFGRLFTTLFTDPVSGVITPIGSFAGGGQNSPLGTSTCAFGLDAATGSCRFNLTQVAANATFKDQSAALTIARGGAGAVESGRTLRFTGSLSGFYTRRSYLGRQPAGVPASATPFSLAGAVDTSYGVNAGGEQRLGSDGKATFDLRVQRNEYGLSRDGKDILLTGQLRYDKTIGRSLGLFATLFAARRWVDDNAGTTVSNRLDLNERKSATVSVGVRYLFSSNRGRGAQSSPRQSAPEG
ncbi:MAG: hypothetical protein Q7J32_02085 [Sphingomonadaceae bacterium]|nr:hypothetical protein [Sphingomonadaceae bacterium]